MMFPTGLPTFLFETLHAAKFETGPTARFLRRQSRRYVVGNLLFQVEFELGIELSFHQRFLPETTQPAHRASYSTVRRIN